MKWRAYYADGVTRDSAHYTWGLLPDCIVGVVVFENPPYRRLVSGGDWVWMQDGDIQTSGTVWNGWVDRPQIECQSCIKQGIGLDDDSFEAIHRQMFEDMQWPL